MIKCTLFLAFILVSAFHEAAIGQDLEVSVTGVRSDEGQVGVLVFEDESGYPNDHKKAVARAFGNVQNKSAEITITGLAPGSYVITVMHDENGNEKLDRDLFGRPKEGYGVSNDPPPRTFGPPRFEEGIFNFTPDNAHVTIKMRYD